MPCSFETRRTVKVTIYSRSVVQMSRNSYNLLTVGREVHHLMRRLGKAAKYGALFEQLAKEKADDRTALEAEVLFQAIIFDACFGS
jgi:hypothetical protein